MLYLVEISGFEINTHRERICNESEKAEGQRGTEEEVAIGVLLRDHQNQRHRQSPFKAAEVQNILPIAPNSISRTDPLLNRSWTRIYEASHFLFFHSGFQSVFSVFIWLFKPSSDKDNGFLIGDRFEEF